MKIKKFNEELDLEYLKNYFNETVYYLYGVNGRLTTELEVGTLESCIEIYEEYKDNSEDLLPSYEDYIILKESREILPEVLVSHKYNI